MDEWVEWEAVWLLRAMDRLQAEGWEGASVDPHEAARETGLDPGSYGYERVVAYLLDEGAIARDERFGGLGLYRMTRRGLEMLTERP